MKLPSFKRIYHTDFNQQDQSLVQKLSVTINNGFEVVYDALNNKLSLADNVSCVVKDVDITVDSAGVPTTTTTFNVGKNNKVIGINTINATSQSNPVVYPSAGIFCTFAQNNDVVTINQVAGLPANSLFTLKIVAYFS